MWATPAAFFVVAVSYTIGWTAFSSLLAYYKAAYGAPILLELQTAYLLPSIPVLVLQQQYDEHFDGKFGRATAMAWRMAAGLGGSGLVCAVYPLYMDTMSRTYLLAIVALLGLCSSIAFGSSYQLVSHFPTINIIALSIGFVGSGPLVLAGELIFRVGPNPSQLSVIALFELVALVTFAGLGIALWLLRSNWRRLERGTGPGRPLVLLPQAADPEAYPFLPGDSSPDSTTHGDPNETNGDETATPSEPPVTPPVTHAEVGSLDLLKSIWAAAACLFLSVSTSILVFPFFTYVKSSGWLGPMLLQALFAARIIGDILGRFLPKCRLFASRGGLLTFGLLKAAMTVPAFYYLHLAQGARRSDAVAVAWVFLFWVLGGYLNTRSYIMAPRWAPKGAAARAGGMMTLVFQIACLSAIIFAFALQALDPSFITMHMHLGMLHIWKLL